MCPTKQPQSAWLAEQELGCLLLTAFFYVHVLDAARPHNCIWSCALAAAGCLNTAFRLHIFSAPPSSTPPALQSSDQARPRPRLAGHLPFPSMLLHACKAVSSTRPSPLSQRTRRAQGWQRPRELGALRCLSREASVAPGS